MTQSTLSILAGGIVVGSLILWFYQQTKSFRSPSIPSRSMTPSPSPSAQAPTPTPPARPVEWKDLDFKTRAITLAVVVAFLSLGISGGYRLMAPTIREGWAKMPATVTGRQATTSPTAPSWGNKQVVRVGGSPSTIQWLTGAVDVRFTPSPGRKYSVESGGKTWQGLDGGGRRKLQVIRRQPLRLSSDDGRPLDITIEWKK